MSHPAQRQFCKAVQSKFPEFFNNVLVADVGSLDINGSNRGLFCGLFRRSKYYGLDIVPGKNVDVVGLAHETLPLLLESVRKKIEEGRRPHIYPDKLFFGTIISTEALEHDKHYPKTLSTMYKVLEPGGLLVITCAGDGREEHGTFEHHAWTSPGTNDYYKNISNEMFAEILPAGLFREYYLRQFQTDLQFYGVKKY